jgi:PKD repeat protein
MSAAQAVTDTVQVVVNEQGVTCTPVTSVDLSLATSGDIYTDTEVSFSANVAPNNAGKPYTYTIDYGDGISTTTSSSDDPLTAPLTHTFTATGTYEVEIAVWNCDMSEGEAVKDTVQVTVSEREEADHKIYLPLVTRNH